MFLVDSKQELDSLKMQLQALIRSSQQHTALRASRCRNDAMPAELVQADSSRLHHVTHQLIGYMLSSPDKVGYLDPPYWLLYPSHAAATTLPLPLLLQCCSATSALPPLYLLHYFKCCLSLATAATLLPLLAPLWHYTTAFLQLLISLLCTDSNASAVIFRAAHSRDTNTTAAAVAQLLYSASPATLLPPLTLLIDDDAAALPTQPLSLICCLSFCHTW